jgi:hypothetical protein
MRVFSETEITKIRRETAAACAQIAQDFADENESVMALKIRNAIEEHFGLYTLAPTSGPLLDPKPWRCLTCGDRFRHKPWKSGHDGVFAPRKTKGYSLNREDYSID